MSNNNYYVVLWTVPCMHQYSTDQAHTCTTNSVGGVWIKHQTEVTAYFFGELMKKDLKQHQEIACKPDTIVSNIY